MSSIANFQQRPVLALFVMFVAGITAPLIITNICRVAGTWSTGWWFLPAALVYGFIGIMIGRSSYRPIIVPLIIVYFLIPFGIILDAVVDWYVWHHDRNLFPFEIVILCILVPAPLGVGVFLGRIARMIKAGRDLLLYFVLIQLITL